jgi:hypothetical protein
VSELAERPIFIVGHPRSGTTLLRYMLSSHPRIHIPEETGFIPFLVKEGRLSARLSETEVRRILERIGSLNYLWRGMIDDIPTFYRSLATPTLQHVLDALYREHIAEYGAARWGDKTPLYLRYIPLLDKIFPTAQVIHLIRDGRDAALSALDKWPEQKWYMNIYYLMRQWVDNVEIGRRAGLVLGPGRYLEVRYESLVETPDPVLHQICTFLGERFQPTMLDHPRLARQVGPGPQEHVEVLKPVSQASVMRWAREMSSFDRKLAARIAGEQLLALGYDVEPAAGRFSPAEHARLTLLAGRYALFAGSRGLLYRLGLLTLNRGMRRQ